MLRLCFQSLSLVSSSKPGVGGLRRNDYREAPQGTVVKREKNNSAWPARSVIPDAWMRFRARFRAQLANLSNSPIP